MNNLQSLLEIKGIDLTDIAAATGLNYYHIQKVVTGVRPSPDARQRIADFLGCKATELWGPASPRALRRLIARAIDERAELESQILRERMKAHYLDQDPRIADGRMVGNG